MLSRIVLKVDLRMVYFENLQQTIDSKPVYYQAFKRDVPRLDHLQHVASLFGGYQTYDFPLVWKIARPFFLSQNKHLQIEFNRSSV